MRDFKKMEVWQSSIKIVDEIYFLTNSLPKKEMYNLQSQMNRCSVSNPTNIAEGASRPSIKEFKHFLSMALGSAFELETLLIICGKQYKMEAESVNHLSHDLIILQKQINSFRKKLVY